MRHFFPAVPVLALAAAFLVSPPAPAQDALALFKHAKDLEGQGRWAEACPVYAEAHRLQKEAIGITLNLAECSKHVGKIATAWSAFQEAEFLSKKEHDDDRARYAHDEAAALEPRLPMLQINAAPTPGLVIRRDEQEVGRGALGAPFPADPGVHTIEATAPGYAVWTTTVKLVGERDRQVVEIPTLQRATGGAAGGDGGSSGGFWGGQRVAGAAVAGVGVAGIAVGSVLGVLTLGKISASKTDGNCNATLTVCNATGMQMQQDAKTTAHGSTAAFAVGGAALVTGVVLIATGGGAAAPRSGMRMTVGPVAGAAMTGVLAHGEW